MFVEVRFRQSNRFGSAEESITQQKRKKIKAAAAIYMQSHKMSNNKQARFDVVALTGDSRSSSQFSVNWIKNIFIEWLTGKRSPLEKNTLGVDVLEIMEQKIFSHFQKMIETTMVVGDLFSGSIASAAESISSTLLAGGTIFSCGDKSGILAAELLTNYLTSGFEIERPGFPP